MPFPNWIGRKRLWTKEKVLEALTAAAKEIAGPLPCLDSAYSRIKKGRLDWPPASRVLDYFGAMSRGWLAAGMPMSRVSMHNVPWTEEEREYLFNRAGRRTLLQIARKLGRSYGAARGQLRIAGVASRHNQGYMSAAEIAKAFDTPYNRVCRMLKAGQIVGKYDKLRNRWEVDLVAINPNVILELSRPKDTHKTWPTDKGDYYSRYGIHRRSIGGELVTIED